MNLKVWEQRHKRDKAIRKEHAAGKSTLDLSKKYQLTQHTINQIVRPFWEPPKMRVPGETIRKILADFESGLDERQLADKYNKTYDTIRTYLYLNLSNYTSYNFRRIQKRDEEICAAYLAGMSLTGLANKFEVSDATIKNTLKKGGLYNPVRGRPKEITQSKKRIRRSNSNSPLKG